MNASNKKFQEAVGVFKDADSLQAAIDELQENGFMRQELSVLAGSSTIEEKLGHIYKRVEEAEDAPDAPRTIFVPLESIGEAEGALIGTPLYIAGMAAAGVVVASGGALLTALFAAAAAGAGGASIGLILAGLLAKHHADYIQEQLEEGGLLLWVAVHSEESKKKAKKILLKNGAKDVHIHEISRD